MDIVALRRIVGGMMSSLSIPTLRWATVTQASPLRIQYPTESEPLPFAPTALGPAPGLGADVLTVQWGTRVTILGTVGQGRALGAGVDLDTYTTYGTWTQGNNSAAASGFNYPQPMAGLLEVFPHDTGAMVWQRYTTYRHTALIGTEPWGPRVYARAFYSGTWSPWMPVGEIQYANDTASWTAATDWQIDQCLIARTGAMVAVNTVFTRTGAAITVPADGNIANAAVLTLTRPFHRPALNGGALSAYHTGPVCSGFVNTAGVIHLTAVAPGVTIPTGRQLSLYGTWPTE